MSARMTTDDLLELFNADHYDAEHVPESIVDLMRFIEDQTGQLDDYNSGAAALCEPDLMGITARSGTLRAHIPKFINEHDDLRISTVTTRTDDDGGTRPRIEVRGE